MGIIITTDSTCDLDKQFIQDNDLKQFPIKVVLGDKTYSDGIDIVPQDIFEYAEKTGNLPKTAAGSIGEFIDFFKPLVDAGNEVIHINISSKASAVNNFANEAAKEFNGKVYVIDSKALSTGQGHLVVKAIELLKQGLKAAEIVDYLNIIKEDINTSFVVDTLEYLHKGGRCSLMALLGSKFLMIHPYIDMVDGGLTVKKKYMGSIKMCIKHYIKDLKEFYPNYDKKRCFITHSCCDKEIVNLAKEKVKELFEFENIIETVAGSVITSHCGRGTIGVLFFKEQVK
jgi:DegV family protein with EDD domain